MTTTKIIGRLSKAANALAVIMLFAMFAHILIEIVLRNVFETSTFVLDEFVGYAVASLTFLGLGEAFHKKTLIEVTILKDWVTPRKRLYFELFSSLSCVFIGALLTFYIGRSVFKNFERHTISSSVAEVPQFIPEGLLLIGGFIFLLRVLEKLFEVFSKLTGKEA